MGDITLFQAATLAIAVLGAVLGVTNTWYALDKSRVKLRVVPKRAIPIGAADRSIKFCIEVTNLSAFAVTVEDVGVLCRGTDARWSVIQPLLLDGGTWPRRLEPRSSVTVYSQRPESPQNQPIKCAYATTQCGVTRRGTSLALRLIARG